MSRWCLWFALVTAVQAAEPVVVRARVEPKEVWRGQQAQLLIDVLGKDAWSQIPNMPALQVSGAYALPPSTQGLRIQETIDGSQYSGQQYQLLVYPQESGTIEIPSFPVEVKSSMWGSEKAERTQHTVPALRFTSKNPPGAEGVDWLVSTESFTATQTWSSESAEVKVGDALKRNITLTANTVSGMAFKPLDYPPMDGLGIYPADPTVQDQRDRGSLKGVRKEEVTYIFQGAGTVEIPAIELVWWDLKNQDLKKVVLEGRKLEVLGGSAATYAEQVEPSSSLYYAWYAILVLVAGVGFWRRDTLRGWYQHWEEERAEHEKVYFKQFCDAADAGDVCKTQAALMQWLDRIHTGNDPAQLEPFLQRYTQYEMDLEVLLKRPSELKSLMSEARKNWQKSLRVKAKSEALLPKLNG